MKSVVKQACFDVKAPQNTAAKIALNRKIQVVASPTHKAFRLADMHNNIIGLGLRVYIIGSRTYSTGQYPRELPLIIC